jgi:hypothetical protein
MSVLNVNVPLYRRLVGQSLCHLVSSLPYTFCRFWIFPLRYEILFRFQSVFNQMCTFIWQVCVQYPETWSSSVFPGECRDTRPWPESGHDFSQLISAYDKSSLNNVQRYKLYQPSPVCPDSFPSAFPCDRLKPRNWTLCERIFLSISWRPPVSLYANVKLK